MIKNINLGNKKEAIKSLSAIRDDKKMNRNIRVLNTHIKDLNEIIGKNVFRKDAVYINSRSLWEVMQPVGGKGSHHYHGLTPNEVYLVLSRLRFSKNVHSSYGNRYVVITDVEHSRGLFMVAILLRNQIIREMTGVDKVTIVITIYPSDRKNLITQK